MRQTNEHLTPDEKRIAAEEELRTVDQMLDSLHYQKLYESRADDEVKDDLSYRLRTRKFHLQRLLEKYARIPEIVRRVATERATVLRGRNKWRRLKEKLLRKAQEPAE